MFLQGSDNLRFILLVKDHLFRRTRAQVVQQQRAINLFSLRCLLCNYKELSGGGEIDGQAQSQGVCVCLCVNVWFYHAEQPYKMLSVAQYQSLQYVVPTQ